jgi:diguanylate cyclase (GGDEF)-like protein
MEGSGVWRLSSLLPTLPAAVAHVTDDERVALLGCRVHETAVATNQFVGLGFRVEAASTADDLLRRLDALDPSVVIVDAELPAGGCPPIDRTVLRIHANRTTPVLVVCTTEDQVRDTLEAGATDVIRRPVSWELAARRATAALESARKSDRLHKLERMLDEATSRAQFEEKRAERLSRVDQVTGLPNSKAFEQLVESALTVRRRSGAHVVVLHLDLSRFNEVNETFGRRGGDEALRQVAGRLEHHLQSSDIVRSQGFGLVTAALARGNGTRFHVVLGNIREPGDATKTAQDLLESLTAPCSIDGSEIYLGGSAGIALAPSDGEDVDTLLRFADMAACSAQRRGPGTVRFFNSSLNDTVERSFTIDRLLRRALQRSELSLHYQPLVQADDGEVVGAEALLRWRSPELGPVPPSEFIPVAEESGQMVEIGAWVLREALRQQRAWIDDGLGPLEMSVNVSRCQLLSDSFPATVRSELEALDLSPGLLVLELSERGVLAHDKEVLEQIRNLKQLGVRLAVDDFGIGDSGIAHLRALDFDVLKIDRSYISRLAESPEDATIASSMIAMARRLQLEVVAEGVEDAVQLEWLRDWGCTIIQGFVFSPAVPADEFSGSVTEPNGLSLSVNANSP